MNDRDPMLPLALVVLSVMLLLAGMFAVGEAVEDIAPPPPRRRRRKRRPAPAPARKARPVLEDDDDDDEDEDEGDAGDEGDA